MKIIARKDAKAQQLKHYFTGKPCLRSHIDKRLVSTGVCFSCARLTCAKYRQENQLSISEYNSANVKKLNQQKTNWRKKNYSKVLILLNKRRADKINRTPSWLNSGQIFEMESVYTYCSALRKCGFDYHVDHIVPLQGKIVSGLHVPWNLQVISGLENKKKGNRFNVQ